MDGCSHAGVEAILEAASMVDPSPSDRPKDMKREKLIRQEISAHEIHCTWYMATVRAGMSAMK